MKTFKEFIEEEVPTCSASGGAIASIGVGTQGEPPGKRSKVNKTLMLKRKPLEPASS